MKKVIILSVALVFSLIFNAQEKFTEGKITMTQTISTDNEQMQAAINQMLGDKPMLTISYVKNNKSRTEISNPMTGDIVTISDLEKSQVLMLMDSPAIGRKYTLTTVTDEQAKEIKENSTIVQGDKTKTILGYECKEHTVTLVQDGVEMTMVMYITDKIVPAVSQQTVLLGDQLKGFPMYIEMKMNQQGMDMNIVTEVTELNKEAVSDSKLSMTPPEGYSKM